MQHYSSTGSADQYTGNRLNNWNVFKTFYFSFFKLFGEVLVMPDYVIETRNLSKIYSKNKVVNSVNMHVEKGKIYGLLGKNGAGKTTTMCMLLNLTYPSGGEVYLFGKDSRKNSEEIYQNIGSIIETPGFYENLTAYENLKIISKLRGDYNPVKINSVLEMVNLENAKSKKYKDFSLGMKQRLGIAAAIMHNPELLILDEPINALDPFGIKEIRALLQRLSHEYGITILISSHILSEIENIADVIGFMDEGVLIDEISKEELYDRLNKFVEFDVSDVGLAIVILKELGLKENKDFTFTNNEIRLYSNLELRDKFNALFVNAGIDVKKVNMHEENLEDFFTRFVSNN